MEELICPSWPALAHASLTALRLAPGSRPSRSSTKEDLLGPLSPSCPSGCDGASSGFDALLPLALLDLASPLADDPASPSMAPPPSFRLLAVMPSLERILPKRLSLICPSWPSAFHAALTA